MTPDPTPSTPNTTSAVAVSRRRFLSGSLATAGVLGVAGVACSDGDDDTGVATSTTSAAGAASTTTAGRTPTPDASGIAVEHLPSEQQVFDWISEVFDQGVRRPGYPADVWAEDWIEERFTEIGLEDVHREDVPLQMWEPGTSSLTVTTSSGETRELEHFPVPYAAGTADLDVELAAFDPRLPGAVQGKASLHTATLITLPADFMANAGSVPEDMTGRIIDDEAGSLADGKHIVPFSAEFQAVQSGSIGAGAAAYIGSLTGSPGDTYEYYVPYTGDPTPIPGVWISESDGSWLKEQLAAGPVRVRLSVESSITDHTSFNIVGDLPGADDEVVIVASHHDGPWSSAVEDGSGIALVLAQAHYWSRRPEEDRPHRLRFVLQGGHMVAGAGMHRYVEDHRDELDDVVLEVHLEHAALEVEADEDGGLVTTDRPTPRWVFTSRLGPLEDAVSEAFTDEALTRSLICAPDAFGDRPPTDGQAYFGAGVPIVNVLAAPWYLFDSIDTIDKIDRASLIPLTRATIRIIDFTSTTTAADLRATSPNP